MTSDEFDVGPSPGIEVHIQSGRVEVNEGSGGVVSVQIETDGPQLVVEQRGDLIVVSTDRNPSWLSANSAYVQIVAPKGTDVSIGTASADIECRGSLGKLVLKTASGEIEIGQATDVVIKTASGDAEVHHVRGDIRVSSSSGDIEVGQYDGKANFSASSGDVRVVDGRGSITASTASGDVSVDKFTGRRGTFKTMSGTATVGVPAGTSLELDATLLSGKLNLPEPSDVSSNSERKMSITAKIVSGDLNIRRV